MSKATDELVSVDLPQLVMPRRETKRWSTLARHLDVIQKASDDAIHKGFCKASKHKLDKALAEIEMATKAARSILRRTQKWSNPH